MTLTNEQNRGRLEFLQWFNNYKYGKTKPFFFISGYAGCGKTFLLSAIANELDDIGKTVTLGAYTGKACVVVTKKTKMKCNTLHSLIYRPIIEKGLIIGWERLGTHSPIATSDLLIVDEVSMMSESIWKDILEYRKPVLVFGDLGQLPPISNEIIFTEDTVDFRLETIHRQALDNPIISLSANVREGKGIPYGNFEDKVIKIAKRKFNEEQLKDFDQIICGRNITREHVNKLVRKQRGFDSMLPVVGDKLICLRNNRQTCTFNGQQFIANCNTTNINKKKGIFEISASDENLKYWLTVFDDEFSRKEIRKNRGTLSRKMQDCVIMDYGFCLTGHKAQGSQWKNVCLFDENFCFREHSNKWLYTCLTRAEETVTIIA